METILFLAHPDSEGALPKVAFEALNGAKTLADGLGARLVAGLFGADVTTAALSIVSCGATKTLGVTGDAFTDPRYSTDAAAAEALAKAAEATIIVAPATSRLSRVLSGVAHRLGGRIDTHATALMADGGVPSIQRWYYRQRMIATMSREQRPWIISVDPGSLPAWSGEAGTGTVEPVSVDAGPTRTSYEGIHAPAADEQTIRPEAKLLFVAGAGWTKKQADGQAHVAEASVLIKSFIDKTQASLGSSKSLVDMGGEGEAVLPYLTHMNQVGQTGSTPRHAKGLSTCCHGEEPHVVGWRFINERRAVNKDAGCGWAQGKADVLYVADAFEVMAKVNELLG